MKNIVLLTLTLICLGGRMESLAQTESNKILIAYFTWSGNSKKIAEQISKEINSDVFEIVSEKGYPEEYIACTEQAKTELQNQERPKLKTNLEDISKYKTVILVYPNWWNTIPMPVATFLESHNFADKTLIPICTHLGSRFGTSINDVKRLAPKAKIGEGFHIRGLEDESSFSKKVSDLLKNNKLK